MQKFITLRDGRTIELDSPEEDAQITAAAMSDPDALPFTDKELETVKPFMRPGRPKAESTKKRITIRLSPDVVRHFKSEGPGWQTRIDEVLRQSIADRPSK